MTVPRKQRYGLCRKTQIEFPEVHLISIPCSSRYQVGHQVGSHGVTPETQWIQFLLHLPKNTMDLPHQPSHGYIQGTQHCSQELIPLRFTSLHLWRHSAVATRVTEVYSQENQQI